MLQKEIEPRQELLSAISAGTGVTEVILCKALKEAAIKNMYTHFHGYLYNVFIISQAINKLISTVQDKDEEPQLLEGEWKMIWSSQVC